VREETVGRVWEMWRWNRGFRLGVRGDCRLAACAFRYLFAVYAVYTSDDLILLIGVVST
jgi:hypothetical protein